MGFYSVKLSFSVSVCLSHFGSRSCSSLLTDLRRVVYFFNLFSFLLFRTEQRLLNSSYAKPETQKLVHLFLLPIEYAIV